MFALTPEGLDEVSSSGDFKLDPVEGTEEDETDADDDSDEGEEEDGAAMTGASDMFEFARKESNELMKLHLTSR